MINRLVFLTEEASMERFLQEIMKELSLDNFNSIIIPHEGKQDLEKSIPRKLRAWRNSDQTKYYFIIVRDKDSGDCRVIKQHLQQLCRDAGREDSIVIIAIHELESWFLGDLIAVEKAYCLRGLSGKQNTRKYKNPDRLANASQELEKICGDISKVARAERIVKEMDMNNNCSSSFQYFMRKMRYIEENL